MTKKVIDIRTRMTPNWLEKGKAVLESMTDDDRETIIAFVFNLVMEDVKTGLSGENAEVFFEMIDKEFRKAHAHCYFSIDVDGNETPYTKDTELCLLCAVKMRNILRAFGKKTEVTPLLGSQGQVLH